MHEIDPEQLLYESTKQGPGGNGPQILTPLQFLDRLATLAPPPRIHRHRYFGVLARMAAHRKFPRRPGPSGLGRERRFPRFAQSSRWKRQGRSA
jgi:hypothetical protein